jgi:hypothetical protein
MEKTEAKTIRVGHIAAPRLPQLRAEAPVRFVVIVRPDGLIQRAPTAGHAHADVFSRSAKGQVRGLTDEAKTKGYALLDELYESDLKTAEGDRATDLANGRDYLFKVYMPAVERGETLDVALNPSEGAQVKAIGDHLLPSGVLDRRKRSKSKTTSLPPPEPTAKKGKAA